MTRWWWSGGGNLAVGPAWGDLIAFKSVAARAETPVMGGWRRANRRKALVVWAACAVFGSAVLCGCSGSDGRVADRSTPPAAAGSSTTTTRGPAAVTTTTAAPEAKVPVAVQEVEDLLAVLAPVVPIPDDARACTAAKVAQDPDLVARLRKVSPKTGVPDGVMDAGSACMVELHALPAFLDGLDEQVDGGLSDQQRACVSKGYLALDPVVLEAAVADAAGATRGVGAAKQIKSMLQKCGVKAGG